MNQVGGVDQVNSLGFGLRQEIRRGREGLSGAGWPMAMACALFSCVFRSKFQLTVDCADFLNIIEKRNVAKGARYAARTERSRRRRWRLWCDCR